MKRILLVEDDKDVRFSLEHILISAGYSVDCVDCAREARAHLARDTYDLILADGRLGDGNGFDIADLGRTRGARTLVITGYAPLFSDEELDRHPYLAKPVRAYEVVGAIMRLIGESETSY